jgi:hypothetical protein
MPHTPYAETRVNTFTTGDQSSSAVMSLDDGGWVVMWTSNGQDGSGNGTYQQVYNADGTARGEETRVNTYTTGEQRSISTSPLPDGGWVVVWLSSEQDGDSRGVYQQRFDPDGLTVGDEERVNTSVAGDQSHARVAALADGGWVVTWTTVGGNPGEAEVWQQRYDADGAIEGGEVQVNTYVTDVQYDPNVIALAGGGWVVNWISKGQDGSDDGVFQQVYDADGAPVGDETQVNTYATGRQGGNTSLTALGDGGWLVTWWSDGQDGSDQGVYQQRYDSDGATVGDEVRVNTSTAGSQQGSSVMVLASGGWVVTWTDPALDGSFSGVYQQVYDEDGTPLGSETRVNTYTTGSQSEANGIALANGGWLQVWTSSGQDGSSFGVYQQAYNADGTANGEETLVNTTTTGDQSAASATALADGGWLISWHSKGNGTDYDVQQQRYDARGQVYGSNHAPTATDVTVESLANGAYVFSHEMFGFSDGTDGDGFASVVISALPSAGKLLLDGEAVEQDQVIAINDLGDLVWAAGKRALAATIGFRVVDDGGTEAGGKDSSAEHTVTFAITSDTWTGTKSADKLVGTDGHDIMIGKRGNDRLTGGAADDSFVFNARDGKDTITDFRHAQGDTIDLSAIDSFASWKDLVRNHISEHGRDLWIVGDDGNTIILRNTDAGDLHKSDFVF